MKNDKLKNQYRINEQIRVREVRIGNEGQAGKGGGEGNPFRTSDR